MTRPISYAAAALLAIGGVALAWYSSTLDLHDYTARRAKRPELVVLTSKSVRTALEHAFAFRMMTRDGREEPVFNSGMCLLAHRLEQNEEITWEDKIVQQAVVDLWHERWMMDFSVKTARAIFTRHQSGAHAASFSGDSLDSMRGEFVDALTQQESFWPVFRPLVEDAANYLDVPIQWGDGGGQG